MHLFYYMRGFPALNLLGVLSQLVVAIQFLMPSANEALPLIFVIACGLATTASPAVECHLQTTER